MRSELPPEHAGTDPNAPARASRASPRTSPSTSNDQEPASGPAAGQIPQRQSHPPAAFSPKRFHFISGVPAGELVSIRDDSGRSLLTYRSFASAIGIVAALTAAIVVVTGVAAALFLAAERHPLNAIISIVLALAFSLLIAMLVPPLAVTFSNDHVPVLTLSQASRVAFPSVTYAVATPEGQTLARIRRTVWSRIGRNRWHLTAAGGQQIGVAVEESLGRALLRKAAGKFNRGCEANVRIHCGPHQVGTIYRRPEVAGGAVDLLDVSADANDRLDRRVAVALATLVLGSEP